MGHQALHFSKAIQRSVGWPFCVERREGRGGDERAPSISPMRGSARLPLGSVGYPWWGADQPYFPDPFEGETRRC